jgi:hypothetical protein
LKETRKAELKGAGLVHGENWAARCEPAEVSDGLSRLSLASCGMSGKLQSLHFELQTLSLESNSAVDSYHSFFSVSFILMFDRA